MSVMAHAHETDSLQPVGTPPRTVSVDLCGILHGGNTIGPNDLNGCLLPEGHAEPHEFADENGRHWRWETDMECTCAHCMRGDGDYCTVFWAVAQDANAPR